VQGLGPITDQEIAEATRLARQAAEIANDDAQILSLAAFTLASFAGEHVAAAAAVDRALLLNPSSAEAWATKGWVACYQCRATEAIDAFDRAMRLSPLDPHGFNIFAGRALAHMVDGRYEEAITWAERALVELPRFGPALRTKIVAFVQLGRLTDAKVSLDRMLELQPDLTMASYRASMATNFPAQLLDLYLDGLGKAGLPEK
jgi:tetratricopeptide (TPR) repeat protein